MEHPPLFHREPSLQKTEAWAEGELLGAAIGDAKDTALRKEDRKMPSGWG